MLPVHCIWAEMWAREDQAQSASLPVVEAERKFHSIERMIDKGQNGIELENENTTDDTENENLHYLIYVFVCVLELSELIPIMSGVLWIQKHENTFDRSNAQKTHNSGFISCWLHFST